MPWTALCEVAELTEGQGKFVQIDGLPLGVFLHGEKVFVLDNVCPHAGGPLHEGAIEDGCAVCPWHGWAFRLESGELRDAPGVMIKSYTARLLHREGKPTLVQADLPMP